MSKVSSKHPRSRSKETASTWDGFVRQDNRDGLTRARIVAAGIAIADADGLPAVSIRKIAAYLDSSAMALYHYVPAKRDLLNLMLDATYTEFEWPSDTISNWRDAMSHFAWESRRSMTRHTWLSVLRAGDPEYGPQCIRTLETLLTSVAPFGLDVRNAIRVLGILFVFVNGFVAAETGSQPQPSLGKKSQSVARQPIFSRPVLATGQFPKVSQFVENGAEYPNDEMFARALNWILDGMAPDIDSCIRSARAAGTKQRKSDSRRALQR